MSSWNINSWKKFVVNQQPNWLNQKEYKDNIKIISSFPPLVFPEECDTLKNLLAKAQNGEMFLLQGGDCAERFNDFTSAKIKNKLKILLQMSAVISYGTMKKIIKVGRMAGQYATPRTLKYEKNGSGHLPVYMGDAVNDISLDYNSRKPNPDRLIQSYHYSAATLNHLRAFTHSGLAEINKINTWNLKNIKKTKSIKNYNKIVESISSSLSMIDSRAFSKMKLTDFFTSHEALLLDYEQALTRQSADTGKWYNCSAHLLWIGNRTRNLDSAHVEFLSGVSNPIAVKIGPDISGQEALDLSLKLNPRNEPGKLIYVVRMGYKKIDLCFPKLIKKINQHKRKILWVSDPMHGNTVITKDGIKTRHFENILQELTSFIKVHKQFDTVPGGVHIELTSDDVTECLGGTTKKIKHTNLNEKYETACDPRLNNDQSLELAFLLNKLLK